MYKYAMPKVTIYQRCNFIIIIFKSTNSLSRSIQSASTYFLVAFLLANLNPDFVIENSIFCSFKD